MGALWDYLPTSCLRLRLHTLLCCSHRILGYPTDEDFTTNTKTHSREVPLLHQAFKKQKRGCIRQWSCDAFVIGALEKTIWEASSAAYHVLSCMCLVASTLGVMRCSHSS